MTDERESLRRQLTNAEENLRLIRERKAEFVLGVDVPLQLVREERRLEARIAELHVALGLKTQEREGGDEEPLAGADIIRAAPTREADPAKGAPTVVGRVLWPFIRYFWLALLALVGLTSGLIQIRQTDSWKPIVITLVALTGIYALIMIVRDRMIRQGRQRRDAEALRPTVERQSPRTVGRALFFSVNVVRYALILIFLVGMAGMWAQNNALLEFLLDGLPVTAMAADPANSDTLYAATLGGLHKTTNAGLSWEPLANEGPLGFGSQITALSVDPNDSDTVYAGTTTIYQSRDAGRTWEKLSVPSKGEITKILVAADDSKKIYAVASGNGILKSIDGGQSWSAANKGIDGLPIADLAVDPSDPDTLYATADRLYMSTNGGAQWTSDTNRFSGRGGVIGTSPAAPDEVFFGDWGIFFEPLWSGALAKRDSASGIWEELGAPTGCATESFVRQGTLGYVTGIVVDPADPQRIFAAAAANQVYKTLDGGRTWKGLSSVLGGVPRAVVLDPDNRNRLFVATSHGVWEVQSSDVEDSSRGVYPQFWADWRSDGLGSGVALGALKTVEHYRREHRASFYLLCVAALGGLLFVVSVISVAIAMTRKAWKRVRGRLTWKRAGQDAGGMRRRITTWRLALTRGIRQLTSAAICALKTPTDGQILIGSILLAAALLCTAMFLLRIPKVNLSISSVEQERADTARKVDAYWACNRGPRPAKQVAFKSLQQRAVAVLTPGWQLRCDAVSYPWWRTQGVYQIERPWQVEAEKCEPVFVEYDTKDGYWAWGGQVSYAEQSLKGRAR